MHYPVTLLTQPIQVLVVDDHELVRRGMRTILETFSGSFQFKVAEADSGEDAYRIASRQHFDLVIMDYQLPGITGDEALKIIKSKKPAVRVLAVSLSDDPKIVQTMLRHGADGYLLKNTNANQLVQAIRTILKGDKFFSSEVAIKLIDIEKEENKLRTMRDEYGLTQREIEVLQLIAKEHTNESIGKELFISKRTVDTHRQNLLHKLRVKNTAGLVLVAISLKLI